MLDRASQWAYNLQSFVCLLFSPSPHGPSSHSDPVPPLWLPAISLLSLLPFSVSVLQIDHCSLSTTPHCDTARVHICTYSHRVLPPTPAEHEGCRHAGRGRASGRPSSILGAPTCALEETPLQQAGGLRRSDPRAQGRGPPASLPELSLCTYYLSKGWGIPQAQPKGESSACPG